MDKLQKLKATYEQLGSEIKALEEPEFEPFWEPTMGENAWYVDTLKAETIDSIVWIRPDIILGIAYETRKLAQKALDYQLAEQRLRKAVWNLNRGPAPMFKEGYANHTVVLSSESPITYNCFNWQANPDWLWLSSVKLAKKLVKSHANDLSIYFKGI